MPILKAFQNSDKIKNTKRKMVNLVMFVQELTKSSEDYQQAIFDKAEECACDINFNCRRSENFFGSIVYRNKIGKNFYFDFNDIGNLGEYYDDVRSIQYESSSNSPSDFVIPFIVAMNRFSSVSLNSCRKIIIWIASSSAQGKKFCGFNDGHQKEEEELEFLVKKFASDIENMFYGIYTNEKAKKAFDEMRSIFESCGNYRFECSSIDSDINFEKLNLPIAHS